MPKTVSLFNGRMVQVPDDWSNEQIIAALRKVEDNIKRQMASDPIMSTAQGDQFAIQQGNLARSPLRSDPEPSAGRPPNTADPRDFSVLDRGAVGARVRGAAKQTLATIAGAAAMFPTRDPEANKAVGDIASRLRPVGADEEWGGIGADIGTSFLPFAEGANMSKVAGRLPTLLRIPAKLGIHMGTGAGVAEAQGHDPTIGAATGLVGPALGRFAKGLTNSGRTVARWVLDSKRPALSMLGDVTPSTVRDLENQVAENALNESALPGWFRKEGRRVGQRMNDATRKVQGLIDADPRYATHEIPPVYDPQPAYPHGPVFPRQNADRAVSFAKSSTKDQAPINDVIDRARKENAFGHPDRPLRDPNLSEAFTTADNTRDAAFQGASWAPEGVGQRAVAADMMDAVAAEARGLDPSVVPGPGSLGGPINRGQQIAEGIARIKRLMPVQEAQTIRLIDEGGVPKISNRILVSIANRAFSPSAQGMWNTGKALAPVADSAAIRSAMSAVLNRAGTNYLRPAPPTDEPPY